MKTILIDIDGTILKHHGSIKEILINKPEVLPGVHDKFKEWDLSGYKIILITGRRKNMRKLTESQLLKLGIFYDELIMGVGRGPRVLINDLKKDSEEPTSIAVNIVRNEGLMGLNI